MVRPIFPLCLIAFVFAEPCFGETATLSFETPYNHITIERGGSIVEMRSVWRSKLYRESAVDLSDPSRLVVPYTSLIAASAMFHPNPGSVLMIGLGGGGFNQFFEKAFPSATLETVEVDTQVCALAEKYLAFKPSDRNKVTVLDGRMFLRRSKAAYDWIILDAFRGGFVPPHLKTVEFYKLAHSHLAPDGMFIVNVRKDTALFASDLRTMRAVFPQVGFFDVPPTENAVIVGVNWESPSLQTKVESSGRLSFNPVFRRNVDPIAAGKLFHLASGESDKRATVLTDDFAPTEFLDAMKNRQSHR
jgi:spermidine synthase